MAIKALAHITGGGFVDNIPRMLPKNCDVLIRKGSWKIPAIFRLLEANGSVPQDELYQVFNMGIGMTIIVAANGAEKILKHIRQQRYGAWLIGEVRRGSGMVALE